LSKTILISFADGSFKARARTVYEEAANFGLFDKVTVFNFDTLSEQLKADHGHYMNTTPRGFGYWIWKPHIILETLNSISTDDILLYMDAGFTLNAGGQRRFRDYIELTRTHDNKLLSFQNIYTEHNWTKADLALRLDLTISSPEMMTSQLGSGLIMLQKTSSNVDMLRQWIEIATDDNYHFSDDTPSQASNHPDFQEHRHDQSIASLLRKLHGTAITHYEVQDYLGAFQKFRPLLPAWATRLKE
jgi:hypothetical protein